MMTADANPDSEAWRPPLVVLVGLGTGKDSLGTQALRWIDRAEVIAGGRRQLEIFRRHPGRKFLLRSPLDQSLQELQTISRTDRTLVLASGDPFFFGIGRRLVEVFGKENLFTLTNVTTIQSLFARLAEPWEDVTVVSLHGRESDGGRFDLLRAVRSHPKVALFTDPRHNPNWIAQQLLDSGISDRSLIVAEEVGLSSEAIHHLSLEQAASGRFSPLNVVVVMQDQDAVVREGKDLRPVFGLPEEAFRHQAGLITKREVRAVVLAHLELKPGLVLWDVGAGSGSVSIEAARAVALRQVVAVEKNRERYEDLVENVRRFRCVEVQPVLGNAADVLDRFADPDRVFIGGSGGNLRRILDLAARRLRPRGCVVQTAVTWDTLDLTRSFWRDRSSEVTITQLQVNRTVPIGDSSRLEALNPVFIVTVWPDRGSAPP